jgi:hypothetical protein
MAISTATIKTSLMQNNSNPLPDTVRQLFNVTTIAAAGSVIGDATAIGNDKPFVLISNNTAANGVRLPTAAYIGQVITIYPQLATNAPKVWPPVGGTINSGTVSASVASTARKAIQYVAIDATGLNWVTIGL